VGKGFPIPIWEKFREAMPPPQKYIFLMSDFKMTDLGEIEWFN